LPALAAARRAGIRAEIYPDASKMKKQMQYANARQIPYVALAGESEIAAGIFTLKNMQTGEQKALTTEQLIDAING
jgi:histidyl-tRNA synthetase